MKQFFNFLLRQATLKVEREKSRWLLLTLLTMMVGTSPVWTVEIKLS
jgi:hypothetical protein